MFIAEAITLTGQAIIQTSAKAINDDLIKITGITKDRIVGVDTDSLTYYSSIYINNKENILIRRIIFKWIPIRLHT